MWAEDRTDANKKGGIKQRRKVAEEVMVWLGISVPRTSTPLVILDEGTIDQIV